MSLIASYDAAIAGREIENDPLQRTILVSMQRLADELAATTTSWFPWQRRKAVKGLYIYGSVGVGKTYLVDLFYNYIAEEKKARFHFHHFMQQVDGQLRALQGKKDPLKLIAKGIAKSTRLLCFDEFLVDDVAYAMILAQLLLALHHEGVVLVISSNTAPDDLYKNGVQRQRFMPAIACLKQGCEVLALNEPRDYRLGREPLIDAYLYPLNGQTNALMKQQYQLLAGEEDEPAGLIEVQNRPLAFIRCSAKVIWFSFNILCHFPRSQLDYLELAERFDSIFLSDVPRLSENHTAQAIMFINFIDVMYDRGIHIIISAAVPIDELYQSGEMKESFKRTLSRLNEMQSVDYLHRHPRRMLAHLL